MHIWCGKLTLECNFSLYTFTDVCECGCLQIHTGEPTFMYVNSHRIHTQLCMWIRTGTSRMSQSHSPV